MLSQSSLWCCLEQQKDHLGKRLVWGKPNLTLFSCTPFSCTFPSKNRCFVKWKLVFCQVKIGVLWSENRCFGKWKSVVLSSENRCFVSLSVPLLVGLIKNARHQTSKFQGMQQVNQGTILMIHRRSASSLVCLLCVLQVRFSPVTRSSGRLLKVMRTPTQVQPSELEGWLWWTLCTCFASLYVAGYNECHDGRCTDFIVGG